MRRNLYKQPFVDKVFHDTVVNVLRLTPEQYKQFQNVSQHFLGEKVLDKNLPRYPDRQLLHSSLQTIRDNDKSTLAALLHVEDYAHASREHDFNRGGGLFETSNSIFKGLWNLIGLGPEFDSFFDWMDWNSPKQHETQEDREYAKMVQESYKAKRKSHIGEWQRIPKFDTKKSSTWFDEDENLVNVALKGTSSFNDLVQDLSIVATNRSRNEEETTKYLRRVAEEYPDSTLVASGHSLSSNQLFNIFSKPDSTLDRYTRANLFLPAVTPTHNLANAKNAAEKSDRFWLFLNSGDMLSNTFVSLLPSDRENVIWGKPHHSPAYNHSIGQWIESV